MKPILAPSILSCDPSNYFDPVMRMVATGVEWIHFDVMDGQFVPPITFGSGLVSALRPHTQTSFEAHLMTLTPETHFDAFISAGCQRIVFHAEATRHAHRLVQQLKERNVSAGVAINPGTPFQTLVPLLDEVDVVLVMTVNPGWGGQQLIESCVDKVRELRRAAPDLEIEVDGGVTPLTIGRLWEAGATTFVAGSFVTKGGAIEENIRELRDSCASRS